MTTNSQKALRDMCPESLVYCDRCGERLERTTAVWLELDSSTGHFHKAGIVKPSNSQGFFSFGPRCAKNALKASSSKTKIRGPRR